jgi:hypothetical protein
MTTSTNDVTQAIAMLDPVMQSITSQALLLNPTDKQDWAGIESSWEVEKAHWATLTAWYQLPTTAAAYADDAMGKVKNYQTEAAQYSGLIKAAGGHSPLVPNVDPVNPPPDPAAGSSWWGKLGTFGKGVVIVAGGAAALFTLDKVTDLAQVVGKFKKG